MWTVGVTLLLFAAHASAGQITLAWDAVSDPNLGGYRLYYGQTSHTYTSHIDVGLQTTYTVAGLAEGQTYYFAVTAHDLTGNESAFSNEVSTTIPAAPVAAFSASPASGRVPLTVAFTNTSTGSITASAWDFGDGTTSPLRLPTHTYTTPGTYSVQLTVTGPGGSTTATKTGYITVAPAIVEVGELSVDYLWKHVTLRQTFVDPIVVATPLSKHDSAPATIRIRNVGPTGFDIRVQEWDYLDWIHPPETVSYLAMERGPHTLGTGIRVEAGRMATYLSMYHTFTAVTFQQSFVAVPVVVTSVTSANETDAVITREQGVTSTGFQVRLQEQCRNFQSHATETIDYIAWAPSAGTVDGLTFEVHTTLAAVTEQAYTIPFNFLTIPMFVAAMQTFTSKDPATLRSDNEGPVGVDLQVQEEASCNHSLTHPAEVVGYMAFTYQ